MEFFASTMWVPGSNSAGLGKRFLPAELAHLPRKEMLLKPVSSQDFGLGHMYPEFCEFMVGAVTACLGDLEEH